jgi:hypothetical protein
MQDMIGTKSFARRPDLGLESGHCQGPKKNEEKTSQAPNNTL